LDEFVEVNELIFPEPLACESPIDGLLFVQLKIVPEILSGLTKFIEEEGLPAQID
jgi:hypothetical protein